MASPWSTGCCVQRVQPARTKDTQTSTMFAACLGHFSATLLDPRANPCDHAGSEVRETHPGRSWNAAARTPNTSTRPPLGGSRVLLCTFSHPSAHGVLRGATASTPPTSRGWSFPPWRRRSAGSDPLRSPEGMVRAWHRSTTTSGGHAPRCSRRRSLKPLGSRELSGFDRLQDPPNAAAPPGKTASPGRRHSRL